MFAVNFAATWAMFGVIWLVQLVQYPSFRYIDPNQFSSFHVYHSNMITPIVGPLMLLELISAFALTAREPQNSLYWINTAGVLAMFAATFLISVPIHNSLSSGYDPAAIERLISTNWIRTALYTVRAPLLFYIWTTK